MSGARVIELVQPPQGNVEGVVKTLENMIELAHQGLLSSVAIAAVYRDGSTCTAFEGGPNLATLLGSLDRLHYRVLMHQDGS